MPTARELRFQAKACLELAQTSQDYFARTALTERVRELRRKAQRAERRQRCSENSMADSSRPQESLR
jgi:hypothetical protein